MSGLTQKEASTYRENGWLVPGYRLSDAMLAGLRSDAEALLNLRSDIRPEFVPLPHIPVDDSPAAIALAERFLAMAQHPDLLDVVESVLGPDLIFWAAALFAKPGGDGREIPWHQDGIYWPIDPPATATLWISLDHSTRANGCLKVLSGTHSLGPLPHQESEKDGLVLNSEVAHAALDFSIAEPVELEPGQMSIHDIHLLHGSEPNISSDRRAGLALRYMPATSLYDRERAMGGASNTAPVTFADRPIWLVRGRDRSGNDFQRGHTLHA